MRSRILNKNFWVETIFVLSVLMAVPALACPNGSYPSVDSWGNQICKNYGSGQTATIQAQPGGCPNGSYPSVDNMGNHICQSFNGGARYYDTSHGCPTGTHPSVDNWGNQVCRPF